MVMNAGCRAAPCNFFCLGPQQTLESIHLCLHPCFPNARREKNDNETNDRKTVTILVSCVRQYNPPLLSETTTSLPLTHSTTLMHFYCPHLLFFLPPLHHCLCPCLYHLGSILIPHLPSCTHCILPVPMHCSFLTLAFSHFKCTSAKRHSFNPSTFPRPRSNLCLRSVLLPAKTQVL